MYSGFLFSTRKARKDGKNGSPRIPFFSDFRIENELIGQVIYWQFLTEIHHGG